ncbi:DHA2 family efflux MFS transporter permease subunit [Paramicrobacterium chengjingii]|uniref:DHA2 family efflux MFS transporter permease subunit n=1 Tax=Paramicrobacterium chengjingii TaxID=2769067 RepID=A0ABX6YKD5_9MICO|nr:DHA2 family efflux MFS transporter permease subunit [Microbacterium chengjingii]QPZ38866.1 DHA2 family efflux MFS transporter permease subunit [Microbacterium chengjingii]
MDSVAPDARAKRLVLVVAILASFVSFLDGSIVNVALPAIENELGGGLAVQQWVVDSYMLTLGAFILLAGSLSDSFGRGRVLTAGLVWFGITSLLCAIAPTATLLIVARALQGIAAALLVPSSLAIITSTFDDNERGRAIGTWTAWTGTAMIIGPLLGGGLVDLVSWRLIFGINVLPIAFTLVLMARMPRQPRPTAAVRVDVLGAVLGAAGLGGLVFALIEQQRFGWASPIVAIPLLVGIAASAAFIFWQAKSRAPMLPLSLFRARNFWVGNVATVFVYGALSFGTFVIVIYLQQVAGFAATLAGIALMPPTLVMLALSGRMGDLASRLGPRFFMSVGPIVAGLGFALMLTVTPEINYWLQLLPGLLIFGLGLSITVAPLTSAILGAIEPARAGIASAVNNAVSRVAGLVSVACAALIIGGTLDIDGYRRAMAATAIMLVAGGIISGIGIVNRRLSADAVILPDGGG